jgi:hypothetical protein
LADSHSAFFVSFVTFCSSARPTAFTRYLSCPVQSNLEQKETKETKNQRPDQRPDKARNHRDQLESGGRLSSDRPMTENALKPDTSFDGTSGMPFSRRDQPVAW